MVESMWGTGAAWMVGRAQVVGKKWRGQAVFLGGPRRSEGGRRAGRTRSAGKKGNLIYFFEHSTTQMLQQKSN